MPAISWRPFGVCCALVAATCAPALRAAPPSFGVAVLHGTAWSPGDSPREGAGEFEVLLRVAQLRREHAAAGLVSVGDHNGTRLCGGEHALRRAALTGLPVVKIARGGEVAADPDALFIDAGRLGEEQAGRVLRRCLELYGAPPVAIDPERPTGKELNAIRAHLRRFQAAFALEQGLLVAAK